MKQDPPIAHEAAQRLWFRYASYLVSAGLLTCFAASFIQLGRNLFTGWNGVFLAPIAFLVALDHLFSLRTLDKYKFPEKEWFFYRLSEWIVLLLLNKAGYYLANGFSSVVADWQYLTKHLWGQFFSLEFFFSLIILVIVWMISGRVAELLRKLEVDERVLKIEQESGIYEARATAREELVSLVLTIGVIMVLVTSLSSIEVSENWRESTALQSGVTNLLAYFFLTLVLLSVTQLNLLSTNWLRDGIRVRSSLVKNWLLTSATVIFILAFISRLLPTGYSIGVLEILNYLLSFLVAVVGYLFMLLSIPLYLVMSFLSSFFKMPMGPIQPEIEPVFTPPPPPNESTSLAWVELLKSIVFWVSIIGLVIFALYYYWHEHQSIFTKLKQVPLFTHIQRFWIWVRGFFRKANQQVAEKVQQSWKSLRNRWQTGLEGSPIQKLNLRQLSPREKVFFYYLALIKRGSEQGIIRQPWQTPYEYLDVLDGFFKSKTQTLSNSMEKPGELFEQPTQEPGPNWQSWIEDAQSLTDGFMTARYSTRTINPADANAVKQIWDRLRKAFRALFR